MKNRSLRSKMILVTTLAITISTIIIMLMATIGIHLVSERSASQIMKELGQENAANTMLTIGELEHSVESMAFYAQDRLSSDPNLLFVDGDYRYTYLKNVEDMAISEVNISGQATAVYCRLTTEITGDALGFIYLRDEETGEMEEGVLTDISKYESSDVEHVGWYYLPKEAKEPVWIGPYKNKNLGIEMMSYVYPLYAQGNIFIGIMGMDIRLDSLSASLVTAENYENASTLLYGPNGDLIYDSQYADGRGVSEFTDEQRRLAEAVEESAMSGEIVSYNSHDGSDQVYAEELENGMLVGVTVPDTEIFATQQRVMFVGTLIAMVLLALSILLTIYFVNGFLKPLNELIAASEQLADGKVDVTIAYKEDDEIGRLGQTFEMMANSIKRYFDHFHSLAYTDSLTGLNNKAAYTITRDVIESEVQMGRASFSIIVMDVNNLKTINDTLGHEKGDVLLVHVTECLRKTFVGFPLYRIGGDEFCCIINDTDPQILITLLQAVTAKKSDEDYEYFQVHYQIAAGAATYEKERDISFDDVFQRADDAMYENKRFLKERQRTEKLGVATDRMPSLEAAQESV